MAADAVSNTPAAAACRNLAVYSSGPRAELQGAHQQATVCAGTRLHFRLAKERVKIHTLDSNSGGSQGLANGAF